MVKLVISRFYFIVLLMLISTTAICQQANNKLQKIIEIKVNSIRLDSLIKTLSRQSNLNFSYNSRNIIPSSIIIVNKQKQSLADWLLDLDKKFHIDYTVVSDHIILKSTSKTINHINRQKTASKVSASKTKAIFTGKKASLNSKLKNKDAVATTPGSSADTNSTVNNNQLAVPDTSLKIVTDTAVDILTKRNQRADSSVLNNNTILQQTVQSNAAAKPPSATSSKKRREKKLRENNYQQPKNLLVSFGASVSKPSFFSKGISSNATGFGLDIKAEKLISHFISGAAEIGYNRFNGAYTYQYYDGDTAKFANAKKFSNFPLLAGIKLTIYHGLYTSVKAGVAIKGAQNSNSAFTISPAVGCIFLHHIDAGIKVVIINSGIGIPYPSPQSARSREGRYGFWSFRVAYVL